MTMIPPYPLAWPDTVPRTARPVAGSFKTSLAQAIVNVEDSLRRFASDSQQKVSDVAVTSMKAGLTNAQPADKGVAIWFEWDGEQRVIAVDRYDKLEHNVQAIHHIIEARRTELRHGGMNVVRQTFRGFTALPAPLKRPWRDVLNIANPGAVSEAEIQSAYRTLAKFQHPDTPGGSPEAFNELNRAKELALAEIGAA